MDTTHLTVELVEVLQLMALKGKPINEIIQNLRSATLPGIVEFGCLTIAKNNSIPVIPNAIVNSLLGKTLGDISSDLGFRNLNRPRKTAVSNLSPRQAEFTTVLHADDVEESQWENYLHRFERTAKSNGFSSTAALNLQSALHEMASNAVIHSNAEIPALVGYKVTNGIALFSVADVGRGVMASLSTNPKYSHLTESVEAIQMALSPGVTSHFNGQGGFGFNSVFKALAEQWGQLRFRSGNGCIAMDGNDLDIDHAIRKFPPPLPGFQVSIGCRANDKDSANLVF